MENHILNAFDKETIIEGLDRILRIICCNKIMVEFQLMDEANLLFELRDAAKLLPTKKN